MLWGPRKATLSPTLTARQSPGERSTQMTAVLEPTQIVTQVRQESQGAWSPRIDAIRERSLAFADSHPRGERLRLVTESYRKTEGEPAVLRRAKGLAHVFGHNTVRLYPEDRLAALPQRF